jgi:4-diphosphocytidyl-2-C-methyl-D-erythritol kinase
MRGIPLLLLLPEERVLTKDAFARVTHFSPQLGLDAYRDFSSFTNDFEEPVFALVPRLRTLKERLLLAGAEWAGMSGSGSTIVGAFASEAERDRAAGEFTDIRTERCVTL